MSNVSIEYGQGKYKGEWQPTTDYKEYDLVHVGDSLRVATTNHTSGATFDELNWVCPTCNVEELEIYVKGRDTPTTSTRANFFEGYDYSGAGTSGSSWDPITETLTMAPILNSDAGETVMVVSNYVPVVNTSDIYEFEVRRTIITETDVVYTQVDPYSSQLYMWRGFQFGLLINENQYTFPPSITSRNGYGVGDVSVKKIGVKLGRNPTDLLTGGFASYGFGADVINDLAPMNDPTNSLFNIKVYHHGGSNTWKADLYQDGVLISSLDIGIGPSIITSLLPFMHNSLAGDSFYGVSVEQFSEFKLTII